MIQEVNKRCVREIIIHVDKEGVDLPDRKKIKFWKNQKAESRSKKFSKS